MNSRVIAFVVGVVGAVAGVLSLVLQSPIAGLIAGLLALSAGALSVSVREPVGASHDELESLRAERDALTTQTAADQERLRADGERISLLKAELLEANHRAESAESQLAESQLAESQVAESQVAESHLAEPDLTERHDVAQEASSAVPTASGDTPVIAANDPSALTDQASQLFSEAYFRVALDARIASARRHLRPVAVALIEAQEGIGGTTDAPADPARAAQSIRETVRDADTACRLTSGAFAIILEDTPENGAVWTVERVRRNLVSRFGTHTMWAGVACYPAHAFSADELLEQATMALTSAREWKQDRIEVAVAD